MNIRIGPLWIHRLEQWDLDCFPLVCVHWKTANRCKRVFCLWAWGVQVRPLMLTRKAIHIGRYYHRWLFGLVG